MYALEHTLTGDSQMCCPQGEAGRRVSRNRMHIQQEGCQLSVTCLCTLARTMLSNSEQLQSAVFCAVAGTIAFAGTVAYVLSFALGAGPVPGLLVPEINSESLRGMVSIRQRSELTPAAMVVHDNVTHIDVL